MIKIGFVVYLEENKVTKNTIKLINSIVIDDTYKIFVPSRGYTFRIFAKNETL